jgi:hypothetical protein
MAIRRRQSRAAGTWLIAAGPDMWRMGAEGNWRLQGERFNRHDAIVRLEAFPTAIPPYLLRSPPVGRTLTIHAVEGGTVALDSGTWQIGKLIDEGGGGRVYETTGPDEVPAAAKFVIGGATSKREFEFDNLADATHVMPILDAGSHAPPYRSCRSARLWKSNMASLHSEQTSVACRAIGRSDDRGQPRERRQSAVLTALAK